MDPHTSVIVILIICLALIIFTFALGVEVGRAPMKQKKCNKEAPINSTNHQASGLPTLH